MDNTTNEVNHNKIKEREDHQQTQYITLSGPDAINNQRSVPQPVSRNRRTKLKEKAKIRHGAKEKLTNLTALKLFVWQEAEKLQ